jgi:hypothetical protein
MQPSYQTLSNAAKISKAIAAGFFHSADRRMTAPRSIMRVILIVYDGNSFPASIGGNTETAAQIPAQETREAAIKKEPLRRALFIAKHSTSATLYFGEYTQRQTAGRQRRVTTQVTAFTSERLALPSRAV